jgi:hypothetical protein
MAVAWSFMMHRKNSMAEEAPWSRSSFLLPEALPPPPPAHRLKKKL